MEKKNTNRPSTTRALVESALLISLATVLCIFTVFRLPQGGSITFGSMIPIMLISIKYPFAWSLLAAFAYSLIQIIQGFYAPPVGNLLYYTLMILLDYVIAFSVLCLAGPIYRSMKNKLSDRFSLMSSAVICFSLRFLCHYFSGIIIWGVYAPPDQHVWLFSLIYNGSYMLGECIVSGIILFAAGPIILNVIKGDIIADK